MSLYIFVYCNVSSIDEVSSRKLIAIKTLGKSVEKVANVPCFISMMMAL